MTQEERERDLLAAFRGMDEELQGATLELVTNAAYGWRKHGEEVAEAEALG